MSEEFVASNGVTVATSKNQLECDGWVCAIGSPVHDALREFFQHKRDQELGRWRDPVEPDFVVYPRKSIIDGIRSVNVLSEKSGDAAEVVEGELQNMTVRVVAARYFAAHPEPKPWHDAKPGEVWVLTIDSGFTSAATVRADRKFQWVGRGMVGIDDVVSARRIYPESSDG